MTVDGCFRIHREWGCSNTDLQPRHMPNKQAWNLELKSANMWCNKSNLITVTFFWFFGLAMIHGLVMCNCYYDKKIQKLFTMLHHGTHFGSFWTSGYLTHSIPMAFFNVFDQFAATNTHQYVAHFLVPLHSMADPGSVVNKSLTTDRGKRDLFQTTI